VPAGAGLQDRPLEREVERQPPDPKRRQPAGGLDDQEIVEDRGGVAFPAHHVQAGPVVAPGHQVEEAEQAAAGRLVGVGAQGPAAERGRDPALGGCFA